VLDAAHEYRGQAATASDHDAIEAARIVDPHLPRRALVLGALPPEGDDLDLVVRGPERDAAAAALGDAGFLPRGRRMTPRRRWIEQWARFRGGTAFSVDLNPAERWGLPQGELEALYSEARPAEGMKNIAHPAPHHVLLLAARRLVRDGGGIDLKRRRRVDRALAVGADDAWRIARERAPLWGLERALELFETAYRTGAPVPRGARARAFARMLVTGGARWFGEVSARRVRSKLPRRVRVVSLSGLDGAGKSTQSTGLAKNLEAMGVDVVIEWMPLGHAPRHKAIRLLRTSVNSVLGLVVRLRRAVSRGGSGASAGAKAPIPKTGNGSPAKSLRQRSELVTHAWAMVVMVHQAFQHRKAVLKHFGSGKVVIFDRYVLDACSQLRFFYGSQHKFRFQKWLVRAISPKAAQSYLLYVPPEVVHARKDDMQYTVEELHEQAALLVEEAARLGIPKIDGTQPLEQIRDEFARQVWSSVG
jgi:thymidylate kinase